MGEDRSGRHWTLSEDLALASQASHGPEWAGWKELLPGRTPVAIGVRRSNVKKMKRSADWTDEQRAELYHRMVETCAACGHDLQSCMDELRASMADQVRRGVVPRRRGEGE